MKTKILVAEYIIFGPFLQRFETEHFSTNRVIVFNTNCIVSKHTNNCCVQKGREASPAVFLSVIIALRLWDGKTFDFKNG